MKAHCESGYRREKYLIRPKRAMILIHKIAVLWTNYMLSRAYTVRLLRSPQNMFLCVKIYSIVLLDKEGHRF